MVLGGGGRWRGEREGGRNADIMGVSVCNGRRELAVWI